MIDLCGHSPLTGPAGPGETPEQPGRHPFATPSTPPPSPDLVRRFEQACQPENPEEDADSAPQPRLSATLTTTTDMPTPANAAGHAQGNACPMSFSTDPAPPHRETGPHEPPLPRRKEAHEHSPLGMTHPLDALFQATPPPTAGLDTVAGPQGDVDGLWDSVAERILVAQTPSQTLGGAQEVRILVGDVLPGTEISLTRHADGSLTALMVTDHAGAFQTLVSGRDELRQRLERTGENAVHIEIRSRGEEDAADMRRRSRGLVLPDTDAEV